MVAKGKHGGELELARGVQVGESMSRGVGYSVSSPYGGWLMVKRAGEVKGEGGKEEDGRQAGAGSG